MHTENLYPSPDSPFAHVDFVPPPPESTIDSPPETRGNPRSEKQPVRDKLSSAPNRSVPKAIPSTRDESQDSTPDLQAQEHARHRNLSDPAKTRDGRSSAKLPSIVDLVSGREFAARVGLAGICILLCGGLIAFHWVLDFAFDVLHYGGNEAFRSSLIDGTTQTIRWFHGQAANTPIIVIGHSLGSVVAAQTLASLSVCETWLNKIVLVTLGSPLNYIG